MRTGSDKGDAVATQYRMTTDMPAGLISPDAVETRLGVLRFFDGLPDEATVRAVYDNLDFQRAVQAFLTALPAAQHHALRRCVRSFGPDNQTVLITESLLDSRTLVAGGNTETIYNFVWLDTTGGPVVIEVPPRVLGVIDDFWGRYVADLGVAGPDRGQGGRYLLLPPGHTGEVPEGHVVVRSRTFGNWFFFRGFLVDGDPRASVENIKKHLRIYPLDRAANPPAMRVVNISGEAVNAVPAFDVTLFENVAAVVQEEPLDAIDPETRGLLAAVGIRKDQPFAPDARMTGILVEAAAVGDATGRALLFNMRDPVAYYYPDSSWKTGWIGGYDFSPGGVLKVDARNMFFYLAWGVSPAMSGTMVGVGSQYAYTAHDAAGQHLDGGRNYRLHLPPDVPAKDFWSVLAYDTQTRSMLQTDQQFPSVSSQKDDLFINPDASVDVYFGPEPPPGKESNWVQTIPGKAWWVTLRLYGPLESWFEKTWQPGEVELVD